MKKEKIDEIQLDRRQFGKILGGIGIATAGLVLGSSAPFARAEEKNPVTGRTIQPIADSPHQVDATRYKRFNGKNMAFNVNSRDLGENWLTAMKKNAIGNIKRGFGSKNINAGGTPQARS